MKQFLAPLLFSAAAYYFSRKTTTEEISGGGDPSMMMGDDELGIEDESAENGIYIADIKATPNGIVAYAKMDGVQLDSLQIDTEVESLSNPFSPALISESVAADGRATLTAERYASIIRLSLKDRIGRIKNIVEIEFETQLDDTDRDEENPQEITNSINLKIIGGSSTQLYLSEFAFNALDSIKERTTGTVNNGTYGEVLGRINIIEN